MNDIRHQIIRQAWKEFDGRHEVKRILDVSANVSTNSVYKVSFDNREPVFAKLSDYGNFDNFREEHIIINNLANNLEQPYEAFLAKSLVKKNELFTYRYFWKNHSAWLVFYNPIKMEQMSPRRLEERHIKKMGRELARFHKACYNVSPQLPTTSKTVWVDILSLKNKITDGLFVADKKHKNIILEQCDIFLKNTEKYIHDEQIDIIPVFVDWNIGNFSVTSSGKLFSRWDYDWFRMSTRVMDFYFFSRVCSDAGDRTIFSYLIDTLMEDRFMLFLKEYHKIYPLTKSEVFLIKECYRFFILNYVIKDGPYFFRQSYMKKLQEEAYSIYFPAIETNFDTERILKALKL